MRSLILAAALLGAGATADARHREIPAATPTGSAVNCLRLADIRETRVRDDQTIDFITRNGRAYRNVLPNSCPSLGFEQRFAYQTSLDRLCSVDIITVLYSTPLQRGASCGLGKFQPVELAKR